MRILFDTGLARAEVPTITTEREWRPSVSELGAVTTQTIAFYAKAIITFEAPLLSKLGTVIALKVWTKGNDWQ